MSDYSPIHFEDMPRYRELHNASASRAADYSFTNIWGWAEHYGLEWRFSDGLCWIRQTLPVVQYWAPMGDWSQVDWATRPELHSGAEFIRVPEELYTLWEKALPGKIQCIETRGQWDYLYASSDLATLAGNRFHKKKNHVNQFIKSYPDYSYQPMTEDCVESVLQMQEEWCKWRECQKSEALLAENTAVARVLRHWDQLPDLSGGSIFMNGVAVAYTVGEKLTDDTLVVHFEKGTTTYRGIYQAINCFYARDMQSRFTYLNREQDLDDPGLRKAKESYYPVEFIKKNTIRIL